MFRLILAAQPVIKKSAGFGVVVWRNVRGKRAGRRVPLSLRSTAFDELVARPVAPVPMMR